MSNGSLDKTLRNMQSLPFVFRTTGSTFSAFYIFPVNPESFQLTIPTRGGVVQTLRSNFENWFGAGVPKGNIRGTFGFKATPQWGLAGVPLPGQLQYRLLEGMATNFYNQAQASVRDRGSAWIFMDVSDMHFFKIRITQFQYERSIQHQFLYKYNIEFLVLEDFLNNPSVLLDSLIKDLGSPLEIFNRILDGFGNFPAMPESLIKGIEDKAAGLYGSLMGAENPAVY